MSSNEEFVVWEPEYNHRGTFSIIVTCVTTLGICVWSSLHLNIPRDRPTWQRNIARKLFWVSIGVVVPELLIYDAYCQYLSAREIRDKVNEKLGFTSNQTGGQFLFDPKGNTEKIEYLLSGPDEGTARDSESTEDFSSGEDKYPPLQMEKTAQEADLGQVKTAPRTHVHQWTLVHGFYATMGGFVRESHDNLGNATHTVISAQGFTELLEERPDLIPDISEDAIRDESKSDGLAKSILIMQVGWFCINCIGRLAQHLPLTLLEVSTVAHAACSLLIYALWWHKPLNVTHTTCVSHAGASLDVRGEGIYSTENDNSTKEVGAKSNAIFATIWMTVGAIYGCPHFLAWNATFATHTERLLWRICTCTIVGAPICFGIFYLVTEMDDLADFVETLNGIGFLLCILVYFPANLYLIAGSLRQLFHLPPAAFNLPVWSSYFPHVS